jgi:hypothetical protein
VIEIPELKKMEVQMPPSIRNVVNYRVESTALKLICIALKRKYDEIPWELVTVVIDIPKPDDRYIPEKITDLLEKYGLDLPSDDDERERESKERINRRETSNLNEEKMAILNEAVNLGCSWAIEEMERLNGILS